MKRRSMEFERFASVFKILVQSKLLKELEESVKQVNKTAGVLLDHP